MILIRRLALLLLLCLIGWSAASRPVRAQTPVASKYMFSDTTLLRDTLDLHFDRLFELADSLRTSPDSLRAYSIRYLLPLDRLASLADSLRVPVDSIGAVLERGALQSADRDGRAPDGLRVQLGVQREPADPIVVEQRQLRPRPRAHRVQEFDQRAD